MKVQKRGCPILDFPPREPRSSPIATRALGVVRAIGLSAWRCLCDSSFGGTYPCWGGSSLSGVPCCPTTGTPWPEGCAKSAKAEGSLIRKGSPGRLVRNESKRPTEANAVTAIKNPTNISNFWQNNFLLDAG